MVTTRVNIVDKNGVLTSRHKRIDAPTNGAGRVGAPLTSAAAQARVERPITDANILSKELKERYPGLTLHFYGSEVTDYATIDLISVPKELRGQGIATKVMKEIIDEADANGWNLALTPSTDFGSSKSRLVQFYSKFGFVPNSGRNKDFTIRETMLRLAED